MLDTLTAWYVPEQGCALVDSEATSTSSAGGVASMASKRMYMVWPVPSDNLGIRPQSPCDCQSGLQDLPTTARHCIVIYHVDHRHMSLPIEAVAVLEKGSWSG